MTKFYIRWQLTPAGMPADPAVAVKLWLSLCEMTKADLKAGIIKDWGMCNDGSCGYAFSELSDADLNTALLKYMPYVSFDVKPVLTVDQTIENIKKAVAAAKAR